MHTLTLTQLVPILQLSIGPVILISGVGLLLLTLTNRFGRMLDRTRQLDQELHAGPSPEKAAEIRRQIAILMRRAGILRLSVTLGAVTILLAGVLMLLLFLGALFGLELGVVIVAAFCAALLALIGSMLEFIHDMNLALEAVRLEIHG